MPIHETTAAALDRYVAQRRAVAGGDAHVFVAATGRPLTHPFTHFVEHRVPSALDQVHRILALPSQKTDRRLVDHITDEGASISWTPPIRRHGPAPATERCCT